MGFLAHHVQQPAKEEAPLAGPVFHRTIHSSTWSWTTWWHTYGIVELEQERNHASGVCAPRLDRWGHQYWPGQFPGLRLLLRCRHGRKHLSGHRPSRCGIGSPLQQLRAPGEQTLDMGAGLCEHDATSR